MSCWAGEDGEEKEVGFTLTQAAVNNSNVAPIPMLWRTGAAGGGGGGAPPPPWGALSRRRIGGGGGGTRGRGEGGGRGWVARGNRQVGKIVMPPPGPGGGGGGQGGGGGGDSRQHLWAAHPSSDLWEEV